MKDCRASVVPHTDGQHKRGNTDTAEVLEPGVLEDQESLSLCSALMTLALQPLSHSPLSPGTPGTGLTEQR